MAVLPPNASFNDFARYVEAQQGPKTRLELNELWAWRKKLLGVKFDVGRGYRETLPADEQDLTMKQREAKVVAEAKSQGRNIELVGKRWV
jgi:hypothetical protein|tara:strand:+ start:2388 stop:2657 length:270 start_codon:yes stop_codon:yes gene_type:complete